MNSSGLVVADLKPANVELNRGQEYYDCTCGKSCAQPLCDGFHAGD